MPSLTLILGGDGMLARAVGRSLAAAGRGFVSLSRGECDVTREEDVRRVFRDLTPAVVINCAARTAVDRCEDEPESADAVNGYAVGTLAAAARDSGAYLVHVSTDAVFDGRGSRPYRPDDAVNPLSAYAKSKLLGEERLRAAAPREWIIVRTAWLFGLGGACFPRTIAERARAGHPLKVVNDQFGSPTYAEDLANAMVRLIDRKAQGVWHVANSGEASWFDVAVATLDVFGIEAELSPVTTEEWVRMRPRQAQRPRYTVLDTTPLNAIRPVRHWREALDAYRTAVERAGAF